MTRRPLLLLPSALCLLASLASLPVARAETGPLILVEIESGFAFPLFLCSPPGDNDRLFIIEKSSGLILIYKKSTDATQPDASAFLAVPNLTTNSEKGLLGLAFHPNYATNGYFYVYASTPLAGGESGFDHWTEIRRYKVSAGDPDSADLASGTLVLRFQQPQPNHNGGWIGFNPAATGDARYYLYIASGDGGGGNDDDAGHNAAIGNGQDTAVLLGKILRIDVGSTGEADDFPANPNQNYAAPASNPFVGAVGRDEIWAYGLRNPWRCSFDRLTGDLWIADVGQGNREEVNFQPVSSSGGENYGWRVREGFADNGANSDPIPVPRVDPVLDYPRTEASGNVVLKGKTYGHSITGGYAYRGARMPWLHGSYVFADYKFEKIWSLATDQTTVTDRTAELGLPDDDNTPTNTLASFGEDDQGNLYLLKRGGTVYEITQNDWYLFRNQHFSVAQLDDAEVSGVTANFDGDDMSNIMEFVTGRTPTLADGPAPLEFTRELDAGDEFLTLTLTRDPAGGFIDLTSESGANLTDFSSPTTTVILDTSTMPKVRDNVPIGTPGSRYLRLQLALPPAP
ncbi:MAG: sorbosone dehydrogenase family protein [Verrucomicrobiales bacterium]